MHKVIWTKVARKDAKKIERAGLKRHVSEIQSTVRENPCEQSQGFEKLKGNLKNMYSRRINDQHRYVYKTSANPKNLKDKNGEPYDGIVTVMRMWTHYE